MYPSELRGIWMKDDSCYPILSPSWHSKAPRLRYLRVDQCAQANTLYTQQLPPFLFLFRSDFLKAKRKEKKRKGEPKKRERSLVGEFMYSVPLELTTWILSVWHALTIVHSGTPSRTPPPVSHRLRAFRQHREGLNPKSNMIDERNNERDRKDKRKETDDNDDLEDLKSYRLMSIATSSAFPRSDKLWHWTGLFLLPVT